MSAENYTISTRDYKQACQIVEEMKAAGIPASITTGGVGLTVREGLMLTAEKIAKRHGQVLSAGTDTMLSAWISERQRIKRGE
jgi:hypothetical protein